MNYIERVAQVRGQVSNKAKIPADVFEFALSLKQPEALARRDTPEQLQRLDPSARQYEKARLVGNASVKFALESFMASNRDATILSLHQVEPHVREDILAQYHGRYQGIDALTDEDVAKQLFATKRGMVSLGDRARAVGSYVNFRTGSYTPDESQTGFGQNDALLVQAFGRNMFEDDDMMSEIVEKRRDLGSDEAMFQHLAEIGFDEGDSNRALADAAADILRDRSSSVEQILQWEVSFSLRQRYAQLFAINQSAIHTLWPKSNFYPTIDVKKDSVEIMRRRGLYNPLELAHPDMTIRAMGILGKLGVAADAMEVAVPFDEHSTQNQTRDTRSWVKHEFPTRVHHVITNRVRF